MHAHTKQKSLQPILTNNPDKSAYFLTGLSDGGASILLSTNHMKRHDDSQDKNAAEKSRKTARSTGADTNILNRNN